MDHYEKKLGELSANFSSILKKFNEEISSPLSSTLANQICIANEMQKVDMKTKVA